MSDRRLECCDFDYLAQSVHLELVARNENESKNCDCRKGIPVARGVSACWCIWTDLTS